MINVHILLVHRRYEDTSKIFKDHISNSEANAFLKYEKQLELKSYFNIPQVICTNRIALSPVLYKPNFCPNFKSAEGHLNEISTKIKR